MQKIINWNLNPIHKNSLGKSQKSKLCCFTSSSTQTLVASTNRSNFPLPFSLISFSYCLVALNSFLIEIFFLHTFFILLCSGRDLFNICLA